MSGSSQGQVVRAQTLDGREVVGVVVSGENGEGVVVVASSFAMGGGRLVFAHEDRARVLEVFSVSGRPLDAGASQPQQPESNQQPDEQVSAS